MKNALSVMGHNNLVELLETIYECTLIRDEAGFCRLLARVARILPSEYIVVGLGEVRNGQFRRVIDVVDLYPKNWMARYVEKNYFEVDPVFGRYLETFEPQIWSEAYSLAKTPKQREFVSEAREAGLSDGITLGIPPDSHPFFSVFSFSGEPVDECVRVIAQLLIPHLHEALLRAKIKEKGAPDSLTQRELEVLKWVKEGKSNWEIAMILNISERTVNFHMQNSMSKLQASTRAHAVAKALAYRLINF